MKHLIENGHLIVDFFGYFPTFHDCEIISVSMDRNGPEIDIVVQAFEVSKEVKSGKYLINKNCRIRFRFINVLKMELKDFNTQNVLLDLSFAEEKEGIKASINSSYGLNGSIVSSKVAIIDLEAL